MGISLQTHKKLWGRAGSRCSFETCRHELVLPDSDEDDDPDLTGEEAHIVPKKKKGPRANHTPRPKEIDGYPNLILLCPNHHTEIDKPKNKHTVAQLKAMKRKHEDWVRKSLSSYDPGVQGDEEHYAAILDGWEARAEIDNWQLWTQGFMMADQPRLHITAYDRLKNLNTWLLGRVWPGRYNALENALHNFRLVLNDLLKVFDQHSQKLSNTFITEKFYRLPAGHYDEKLSQELHREYTFHVKVVEDLALELTRAANLVCQRVRESLFANYRRKEGLCLIEGGPYADLSVRTYRAEYTAEELSDIPYPGLNDFKKIRCSRTPHSAVGESARDPEFLAWFRDSE